MLMIVNATVDVINTHDLELGWLAIPGNFIIDRNRYVTTLLSSLYSTPT